MLRRMHGFALAALFVSGAVSAASQLTEAEYRATLDRADADYKVAKERCDDLSHNPKDVCKAEAKAAHMRARAEANANYRNTANARADARAADAEATYIVAKERCYEKAGNARDVCIDEAKADFTRAKGDSSVQASEEKAAAKGGSVQPGPGNEPTVGDRQAAKQQCELMTGTARDECMAAAERPGRM